MRILRVVFEGLLVAFLAALVGYELRHYVVVGLLSGIGVCLIGIGAITLQERRLGSLRRLPVPAPARDEAERQARIRQLSWYVEQGRRDLAKYRACKTIIESSVQVSAFGTWIDMCDRDVAKMYGKPVAIALARGRALNSASTLETIFLERFEWVQERLSDELERQPGS